MGLGRLVGLRTKVRSGGPGLGEEARENWLDEGTEDDLSATVTSVSHVLKHYVGICELTYPVWGRAIHKTRTNLKV